MSETGSIRLKGIRAIPVKQKLGMRQHVSGTWSGRVVEVKSVERGDDVADGYLVEVLELRIDE